MIRIALVCLIACGHAPPPAPPAVKSAAIADGNVEAATVAGHVTLVDYWSESCGACGVVAGMIAVAIAREDRIIVRKIDVGDRADIRLLPHWQVYDRHRRLRYRLFGKECLRAPALAQELLAEP